MIFNKLPLYRAKKVIRFPASGEKNISLAFLSENSNFLETFNFLKYGPINAMRFVFVPTTTKPITRLTSDYKSALIERRLRPIKGYFGDFSALFGKNFYMDLTTYLNAVTDKFKLKKFNTGRGRSFVNQITDTVGGIPEDMYERVLLYSVNIDNPLSESIIQRRFFPILRRLMDVAKSKDTSALPFDKIIYHVYDHSGSFNILLYDKNQPINIGRIKSILQKTQSTDIETEREEEKESISIDSVANAEVVKSVIPKAEKPRLVDNIKAFLNSDPTAASKQQEDFDPEELAISALAYSATGDVDKAKTIAKQLKDKEDKVKQRLVRDLSKNLIAKPKPISISRNSIVSSAKPSLLVDNQSPSHIIDKRKRDFKEMLRSDLRDVFKPFENEQIPIKVKSMNVGDIISPPSELKPTLKERYQIELLDGDGNTHNIEIDLPKITDNGTFLINGQPKILVNQLIPYPIFFFQAYSGRLETVYATVSIHSKRLARTSYLICHISGYKNPLVMVLAYKYGFAETMKLFGVKYQITSEKTENSYRFGNEFISFTPSSETGRELVESFIHSISSLPANGDIESSNYWRDALIKANGTRNCIYSIDQVWKFILTPIETKILAAKGDPTTLPRIFKYISEEVVAGRVDDRNSLDKQRIRTSEIFTHLIQKQVISAYNEFLAKKLGGDENARISIDSRRAYNMVVNSQNVQMLESINPLEELSMMTRISPIGLGGIPDKRSFPQKAMNNHYTYYGNIDPLETPDGPDVGIQQHLSVGASITNVRGMFGQKDRNMVKPAELLSTTTSLIPFVNANDGARVLMGSGQAKQAFPLLVPEAPAVQTGMESVLASLLSDNFIKKSPVDGKIISIDSDVIKIKDKSGKIHSVDVTSRVLKSGQGKHGLSRFKPTVDVGKTVKVGGVIAEGGSISEGLISNGLNTLVAYMSWKGYNFEDGVVISESMAKRFTSVHHIEEHVVLESDDDVVHLAEIGESLEKGGILLTYTKATSDVESYRHLRTEGGVIANIEIYSNVPKDQVPEKLKPLLEKYSKYFVDVHGKYPRGSFQEKGVRIEGILVRFILEQRLAINKGDKMNNRHGNKGVVAIIEKDENMPLSPWGERVDVILSTLGIVNRMNNGQVMELHTGLVARGLAIKMNKMKKNAFITLVQRVLNKLDGTNTKEYAKRTIQSLRSLSDKEYMNLTKKVFDSRFFPIIIPPFKIPSHKDIMDAIGIVGMEPAYPLKIEEYNVTTDPVALGYVYMQKLEHLSEKKMSSRGVGAYVSKTLAPTAGKRRGGGQKVGEYDMYSLLAWDAPYVIDEFFGPLSSDHVAKNQMIYEVIQNGETNMQKTSMNPVKDQLTQMMLAIHLESE